MAFSQGRQGSRVSGTPLAVVTGASAGIGEAIARRLAQEGFRLRLGARREDRIRELARELGAEGSVLDVSDEQSVAAFCAGIDEVEVLVNNAGGARGGDPVASADSADWRWMWEVNVLGLMQMTRALLPALEGSGRGHVVNISSTAGFEVYEGGSGYTSAKHAVHAISQTLRLELVGRPIRVTEISPGMVETDFSLNRYPSDPERAAAVYRGVTPLTAADIADVVAFAVTRPAHVNLDQIVLRPVQQAAAYKVSRRST
ncbi:MAG TPA: SDR family NAD(P)-dependent oxidoreductase [Candidatus Saccharimonadales bacterium]|nr:SDR family NAD(P)-dependent oxidoreductase [Candidatus Saccharimonadales bacterium]